MVRYDRPSIVLAVFLSSLAGFVDAIGFLHLGGFFVSFMSGNSTRLAVAVEDSNWHEARIAGGIIAMFVSGVILGSFSGHFAGHWRRPVVLCLQTLLLIVAAWLHRIDLAVPGTAAVALAMGVENTVFQRDGEVSIGLTYMTGTLVKMGQRLAGALLGGPLFAWVPYLVLWLGLAGGALAGAWSFQTWGLDALWVSASLAASLTLTAWMMGPREA
ncbi:YoaK family protein [Terrihabitans sp. B22-R8]|uniref:YoaK family protein n=1 Tax=Terrihabitans sp. B22-R8 TaxID=3425128 RepID=UPI00403C756A